MIKYYLIKRNLIILLSDECGIIFVLISSLIMIKTTMSKFNGYKYDFYCVVYEMELSIPRANVDRAEQ